MSLGMPADGPRQQIAHKPSDSEQAEPHHGGPDIKSQERMIQNGLVTQYAMTWHAFAGEIPCKALVNTVDSFYDTVTYVNVHMFLSQAFKVSEVLEKNAK